MSELAAVREHLPEARRRGEPFDSAWAGALHSLPRVPANYSSAERDAVLGALDQTAEAWRDAYEGRPAPRNEQAAARLQSLVVTPI